MKGISFTLRSASLPARWCTCPTAVHGGRLNYSPPAVLVQTYEPYS